MTDAKHSLSFLLGLIVALGLIVTSTLAFAADTSCGVVYVVDGMSYGLNSLDQIDEPNQKEKRKTEKEAFQFCHVFYEGFKSSSNFDVILPILNKIHDKTGITALLFLKVLISFFRRVIEKSGLAAS